MPYKVVNKKAGNVINTELNRLGLGFNNLPKNMGEPMLELSGEQYQRYIELYNNPMATKFANKIATGNIPTALQSFEQTILGKMEIDGKYEFRDGEENYLKMFEGELQPKLVASNRKHKITLLRRIDSKYKDIAKKLMFLEYPDLLAVKNQRESYENEYGKNPPMINSPTKEDLDTAKRQRDEILSNAVN